MSDEVSPSEKGRLQTRAPDRFADLDPGELLARALDTVRPSGGNSDWLPPEPQELALLLPQFRIEELLGHGGMGAVYKGSQPALDRPVAIKLLPAELARDEQFVARFRREARMLAKLQHPGIVNVYNSGQTSEGHLYFVMEFVEGADLHRVLRSSQLSAEQSLELISQVCDALEYAHGKEVIHRDIKPGNILITTDGQAKLADFGLARPINDEAALLTGTNVIMGTADYMAPEQRAGNADQRADIYALGVVLYEMLVGKPPRGTFEVPSSTVGSDVRLDQVIISALQQDPEKRYQHIREMKTDVDRIRNTSVTSIETLPEVQGPPMRFSGALRRGDRQQENRRAISIAAILMILLAAASWGVYSARPAMLAYIHGAPKVADADKLAEVADLKARLLKLEADRKWTALGKAQAALAGTGKVLGQDSVVDSTPWGLGLVLRGLPVSDLTMLESVPVDALNLSSTTVKDLSPLRGLNLRHLSCDSTFVDDVSPLLAMPKLESAMISQSVANIEVLRQHPSLKFLGWEGDWNKEKDHSRLTTAEFWKRYDSQPDAAKLRTKLSTAGLRGFQLDVLPNSKFSLRTWATDLSPLAGTPLNELDIQFSRATSLEPLRDMPLAKLWAHDTDVEDLSPLSDLPLTHLSISRTRVKDLSPLAGLPLQLLFMERCWHIKDITVLSGIPTLKDVVLPDKVDPTPLRALPNLQFISYTWNGTVRAEGGTLTESAEQPAAKFWEDFDAKQGAQKELEQARRRFVEENRRTRTKENLSEMIRVPHSTPPRPLATPPTSVTRASYPVARPVEPQRVAIAPARANPASTPIPVGSATTAQMRSLGNEIAAGKAGALELLEQLAKDLYQDVDLRKDEERKLSNLKLMRAAFDQIAEAAGAGSSTAFAALERSSGSGRLGSFATDGLGIAAAAGHEKALDILLNHERYGILQSTAVFALFPAARAKNEKAVAYLIDVLEERNYFETFSGLVQAILPAAQAGHPKAKAALDIVAQKSKERKETRRATRATPLPKRLSSP